MSDNGHGPACGCAFCLPMRDLRPETMWRGEQSPDAADVEIATLREQLATLRASLDAAIEDVVRARADAADCWAAIEECKALAHRHLGRTYGTPSPLTELKRCIEALAEERDGARAEAVSCDRCAEGRGEPHHAARLHRAMWLLCETCNAESLGRLRRDTAIEERDACAEVALGYERESRRFGEDAAANITKDIADDIAARGGQ